MSRDCAEYRQQLTLFHYHELDAGETEAVETHITQCGSCERELQQLRKLLSAVPQTDFSFNSAQRQRFSEKVMTARRRRFFPQWGTWGGVLAGAAVLIYLLILPVSTTPPPSKTPALVDFEILEQLELLQDMELLQDLELLQQLEEAG